MDAKGSRASRRGVIHCSGGEPGNRVARCDVDKPGNLAKRVAVEYAQLFCMNKRALIRKIVARLTDELEVYFRAAQASRAEATHEQSKAENKYDTRGLEASYLARGQSRQAAEIQGAIAAFEKLDARKFGPGEPIDVGAFVELALDGEKMAYFIGPRAGGTEVLHEKREVLVITPQSPLGEQLVGRKQGEVLKLKLADAQNQYRVTAVV